MPPSTQVGEWTRGKASKRAGKRARRHADNVVHQLYSLSASDRTGGPHLPFPWHRLPPIRRVSVVPHAGGAGERETSPHAGGPGAFQGSSARSSVAPPAHAPARIYAHKEGAGLEGPLAFGEGSLPLTARTLVQGEGVRHTILLRDGTALTASTQRGRLPNFGSLPLPLEVMGLWHYSSTKM